MASHCRACGAEMIWAKTTRGRALPLDAKPDPKGNVTLDESGLATVYGAALPPDNATIYMPHHATCPNWGKATASPKKGLER